MLVMMRDVLIQGHGAGSNPGTAARYVDRFEKRGGEWRIKTRVLLSDWQAVADASRMGERLAVNHRRIEKNVRDASHERPVVPLSAATGTDFWDRDSLTLP
jgi:hypothetical protein